MADYGKSGTTRSTCISHSEPSARRNLKRPETRPEHLKWQMTARVERGSKGESVKYLTVYNVVRALRKHPALSYWQGEVKIILCFSTVWRKFFR